MHPLGKSPVITDDGVTVAESGAIVEYLRRALRQGPAACRRPARRSGVRYTYWLHFAEGSAMPPLLLKLVFDRIETAPMPFFVKPIARGISRKVKAPMVEPEPEAPARLHGARAGAAASGSPATSSAPPTSR